MSTQQAPAQGLLATRRRQATAALGLVASAFLLMAAVGAILDAFAVGATSPLEWLLLMVWLAPALVWGGFALLIRALLEDTLGAAAGGTAAYLAAGLAYGLTGRSELAGENVLWLLFWPVFVVFPSVGA